MSSSRHNRTSYSQLSQHQRDDINTKKRASYHRNKKRRDNLFPVTIEDQISAEENIVSSLFLSNIHDHATTDHHIFATRSPYHALS